MLLIYLSIVFSPTSILVTYFYFSSIFRKKEKKVHYALQVCTYTILSILQVILCYFVLTKQQMNDLRELFYSASSIVQINIAISIGVTILFIILGFALLFPSESEERTPKNMYKGWTRLIALTFAIFMISQLGMNMTRPLLSFECQRETRKHPSCKNFIWYKKSPNEPRRCLRTIYEKKCLYKH